jgi:flavorubredoxin
MWKSTEMMIRSVAEGIISEGVEVNVMKLGDNHHSDIMTEILNSSGVVVGSSTLNNEYLPRVAAMTTYMKGLKPKGKLGLSINSYGWSKMVLKKLNDELKASGIKLISDGYQCTYVPGSEDIENCFALGSELAKKIKERNS